MESLRPRVLEFNLLRMAVMATDIEIEAADSQSRTERAFVAVYRSPGSTTEEIAAENGLPADALDAALRTLANQGLAHQIGQHWYPGPLDPALHGLVCAPDLKSLHLDDESRTEFRA